MKKFFVGVDFGQSVDYTAIAVLERAETTGEWDAGRYAWQRLITMQLRYLERLPRGTPYPEAVARVAHITTSPELAGQCCLAADGTGVGRAVVDMLRDARPGCQLLPVNITSGLQETYEKGYYGVPKRDLILSLQVLLQRGLLQIPTGLHLGDELVEEMASMKVKISNAGHEQFAAWREGTHDDLVFAVALAYWNAQKVYPKDPVGAAAWWTNSRQAEAAKTLRGALRV